jgi:hypothetical protein
MELYHLKLEHEMKKNTSRSMEDNNYWLEIHQNTVDNGSRWGDYQIEGAGSRH